MFISQIPLQPPSFAHSEQYLSLYNVRYIIQEGFFLRRQFEVEDSAFI